jgi:glycosyltransferase involved in cell wall biosynthesis
MQQSKILLHTSSYEGQSTVITEALASGMYVLCFDVGRIGSHSKLIVCESFSEMAAQASELLNRQTLDYAPVVLFTERETVHRYKQILFSAEIN